MLGGEDTDRALTRLRVMTWNIHGGIGPDGRCDLERIMAIVRRHQPDILALQEVDSRNILSSQCSFSLLAERLGAYSAAARLIQAPDGDYGHLLITRWPIGASALHDVSVSRREPRAAIAASVATPAGPLDVVATHLGLGLGERRRQAALLAELGRSAGPAVFLGDFNDWLPRGAVEAALSGSLTRATWHRTFPARLPLLALDRIYVRPAGLLIESWTDPEAREASDHLPVIADLDLACIGTLEAPAAPAPQSSPAYTASATASSAARSAGPVST